MGKLDAIFGVLKNPVEAVAQIWGERSYPRKTLGSPELTRAIMLLESIRIEAKALDDLMNGGGRFVLPEAAVVSQLLADAKAGHGGWEVDRLTGIVQASAHVQIQKEDDHGNGGRQ